MNQRFAGNVAQDLIAFWFIVTVSLCIGLLLNQLRDNPIPLVYQTKAKRLELSMVKYGTTQIFSTSPSILSAELSLEEFKIFVAQKQGLVLDARPEVFHRVGHVPGALSLPRVDFENGYAKFHYLLERDKNQWIAVYCSGFSCEDSRLVQAELIKLGYTHVTVFRGGWSAWSEAGLHEEKSP